MRIKIDEKSIASCPADKRKQPAINFNLGTEHVASPPFPTHEDGDKEEEDKDTCIVFDIGAITAMTASLLTELNSAKED